MSLLLAVTGVGAAMSLAVAGVALPEPPTIGHLIAYGGAWVVSVGVTLWAFFRLVR